MGQRMAIRIIIWKHICRVATSEVILVMMEAADPEWGGRGIGTVLFNMLMQEFVDEGAAFSSLFTGLHNHAQKIYMRAGMHVTARFAVMSCVLDGGEAYEKRYF